MMAFPSFAAALLLIAIWQHSSIISVRSFTPSTSRRLSVGLSTTRLTAQKKKGFAPQPKNEAVESRTSPSLPEVDAVSSASSPATSVTMNAGQIALEKLRREKAEQKDAELRRVRDMLNEDRAAQTGQTAIPEQVARRMGQRMLPFVGLPLFLGMGTFVGFWYMATYRDSVFQPTAVAITTIVVLVFGLLGITYSVLSASWDPDRSGSALGWDEFQRNIRTIQEGLVRSRENSILREKLNKLSEGEIRQALQDLERREKQATDTKEVSFQGKLQRDMEE